MARIPQPFSNDSILTGPVLDQAPINAFTNDGLSSVARGLHDLGRGIVINKKTRDQIAEKQKQKDDQLWLNKALSQYHRNITDFEVNPENRARRDLLPAFLDKAEAETQVLLDDAPSPEAAAALEEKIRGDIDNRYPRIATQAATNEMAGDLMIIEDSWGQSLSSYHQMLGTDPQAAASDLLNNLATQSENIAAIYWDVDQEFARKQIARKIEDAALAMADKNPIAAKNLTTMSEFLDESTRQALLNKIEAKQKDVSLVLKEDFTTAREKTIIAAQKSGAPGNIPLEDYQAIYPGEEAVVMKQRDDNKISAAVGMHEFLRTTKGKVPEAKSTDAARLYESLDTEDKLQAYGSIVAPALTRDQRLYEADPSAWVQENNESITSIQKELDALNEAADDQAGVSVEGAPDQDSSRGVLPPMEGQASPVDTTGTREQLYSAILKYQGYPIEGGDPAKFMRKPPSERRLLTKNQADELSAQINGGTVDTAIATINTILEEYPTDELRAQVINDLVNLPVDKIRPEMQIAFQNAKQPWLPDFIGAMRGVGDLASMDTIKQAEIKTAISSNGTWAAFKSSTMGPQNQRSGELAGYFDAIETFAKTKVLKQGLTPKKAVDAAIQQVLASTMAPVAIPTPADNKLGRRDSMSWNQPINQQLWVPRVVNGEKLNDDQLQDLGRRMGTSLAHIHPDDVDLSQFNDYLKLGVEDRRKLIFKQIRQTGNFYPDPGGTTYRVTIANKAGERVDLRYKDGSLFQLPLDKLPDYKKMGTGKDPFPSMEEQKDGYPKTGYFWNFTK
jgi:hypothetical protein